MTRAALLTLALCGLCGCASSGDEPRPEATEITVYLEPPPNVVVEVRDFEWDWEDLDRDDQGRVNAYDKARWVTERHNEALRLINMEPIPARIQGKEILEEILRRDPGITRSRFVLARILFLEAAYWYRLVDHWGYYMTWLIVKRFPPENPERTLSDEELEEALTKVRPKVEEGNRFLRTSAEAALRHFTRYSGSRPDDQQIIDYVWKLNLYLQNYREALGALQYLLAEWEAQDMSSKDPARIKYMEIRDRLENYLAEVEIEGTRAGRDPLEWRARERSILEGSDLVGESPPGRVSSPNR